MTATAAKTRRNGFTLIELLVTVSVIALLIALVLPGLGYAVGSARAFSCQMSQRTTAFDFTVFADPRLHGNRGEDTGRVDFDLDTFQASQYGVQEFWRWGDAMETVLPDAEGNDPMRCPEVREPMILTRNRPCSDGGVGPLENISFAFNFRLKRNELEGPDGRIRAKPVRLRETIIEASGVPLAFDVDARKYAEVNTSARTTIYSAPALDSRRLFVNDKVWFPGMRHNGNANFAFVDGHVDSSSTPLEEAGWNWAYQPGS